MAEQNVVSFESLQKKHKERQVHNRWTQFYQGQAHEELLEALVHEHENDFPLRRSFEMMDQMRHRALVEVLEERAQTEFLKSLLQEIRSPEFRKEEYDGIVEPKKSRP